MVKRWIIYIGVLLGAFVFYVAHGQWISFLLLTMVLGIPLFSLAFLLLQCLFLRPQPQWPAEMTRGQPQPLEVSFSKTPLLYWTYKVAVRNTLTGEIVMLTPGENLPANHCGQLLCSTLGLHVTDPLGLFRVRLLPWQQWAIPVKPTPVPTGLSGDAQRLLARSWQPKPGGGFSEQHDLRLYRPGDSLNQLHWKLSAKTGKLIIREPMIPCHGRVLMTMYLRGTPEQLDEKFGNLLWMGNSLLEMGLRFELQALTGQGTEHWSIAQPEELEDAICTLLRAQPAAKDGILEPALASWHCHIGGDMDET